MSPQKYLDSPLIMEKHPTYPLYYLAFDKHNCVVNIFELFFGFYGRIFFFVKFLWNHTLIHISDFTYWCIRRNRDKRFLLVIRSIFFGINANQTGYYKKTKVEISDILILSLAGLHDGYNLKFNLWSKNCFSVGAYSLCT